MLLASEGKAAWLRPDRATRHAAAARPLPPPFPLKPIKHYRKTRNPDDTSGSLWAQWICSRFLHSSAHVLNVSATLHTQQLTLRFLQVFNQILSLAAKIQYVETCLERRKRHRYLIRNRPKFSYPEGSSGSYSTRVFDNFLYIFFYLFIFFSIFVLYYVRKLLEEPRRFVLEPFIIG